MAEYPEILQLSRQMNSCVAGKSLRISMLCKESVLTWIYNLYDRLIGNSVIEVCNKGKWIHLIFRSGLSFANQPRNGRRCTVF